MGIGREIRNLNRFKEVVSILIKNDFGSVVKRINLHRDLTLKERLNKSLFEPKEITPRKLRKTLEELGGGFAKLGQMLSLRPDLIPEEYCAEFAKLQDSVPAFSSDKALSIIESELNLPIEKIFKSFSKEPLAAASIAQVHEAVLVSGRKVIVKVQRPGIQERIKEDLNILGYIKELFEKYDSEAKVNIDAVFQETERNLMNELDFRKEARNIDQFYKYNIGEKDIIAPKAHLEYATEMILVMDFIEGKELKKMPFLNKNISAKLMKSVMKQVFIDGFFHGNLCSENIIVKGDKIAFTDFKTMGHLSKEIKTKLFELFSAASSKNSKKMAEILIEINLGKGIHKEKVIEDLSLNFNKYYSEDVKEIDFSRLYKKTFEFARKDGITLPTDFVLLGKTMMSLEGLAKIYDTNFNLMKSAKPFIKKNLAKESPSKRLNNICSNLSELGDFLKPKPKASKNDATLKNFYSEPKKTSHRNIKSKDIILYWIVLLVLLVSSVILINEKILTIFNFSLFSFIGFLISGIILIKIISFSKK